MKRVSLPIICVTAMLLSCASSHSITTRPAQRISVSAKKYVETCPVPDERYFIRQFNARVFRHQGCMNVKDLLTVIWSSELTDASINGASFLAVGYAVRLTRMNPDEEYFATPLGVDTYAHEKINYHISFFELKQRRVK